MYNDVASSGPFWIIAFIEFIDKVSSYILTQSGTLCQCDWCFPTLYIVIAEHKPPSLKLVSFMELSYKLLYPLTVEKYTV